MVATSAECAADADWPRSPAEENEDEEHEDLSNRFFGLSPNAVFFAFFFGCSWRLSRSGVHTIAAQVGHLPEASRAQ